MVFGHKDYAIIFADDLSTVTITKLTEEAILKEDGLETVNWFSSPTEQCIFAVFT